MATHAGHHHHHSAGGSHPVLFNVLILIAMVLVIMAIRTLYVLQS